MNETLKWFLSLPILMPESFWWWQCSDRYDLPLPPSPYPFPPSLISLVVSVDVKRHVYFWPNSYLSSTVVEELMGGSAACLARPGGCGVPFMRANRYRSTRSFCSQVKSPTSTLPVTPYLQRTWAGELLTDQQHHRWDQEKNNTQKPVTGVLGIVSSEAFPAHEMMGLKVHVVPHA